VDGALVGYGVFGLCSTLAAPLYAEEGAGQLELPRLGQSRSTSLRIIQGAGGRVAAASTACLGENTKASQLLLRGFESYEQQMFARISNPRSSTYKVDFIDLR
jgi:hypothetical protein